MIFRHFLLEVPGLEPNAYIVGCEDTREAMLVDAGVWDPRMSAFLAEHGLRLTTIFLTHSHWDHVDGLADAIAATGATAISSADEMGGCPTRMVGQDDTVRIGRLEGRVVCTPGHTPDGISLILPGHVFSGDALFCGSVGGTSNPADYERQLRHIREQLFVLPGHYEVHSGHGPATTIGVECGHNPFFH